MAKQSEDKSYLNSAQELDLQEFKDKLEEAISGIHDPRAGDNQHYPFSTLMGIILCAAISGANSILAIAEYAAAKRDWLSLWLDIPERSPSYSVFWWLLVRLEPNQTEQLFRQWICSLNPSDLEEIIAIDGKRVRGASRKGGAASLLHMVSAWSSSRGLILGQLKTEEKSNEITAIPKLIKSLDISDAILTIDAMGCQKDIVSSILKKGGHYVIGLKGNQHSLYHEALNFFKQAQDVNFEGVPCSTYHSVEGDHGRIEERDVYVTSDIDWLPQREDWAGLKSLVMISSRRTIGGKRSQEARYYMTSLEVDAEKIGNAIRTHWGIENSVHWVLDVTFEEDLSLITTGHAALNFSVLKRLTLNMLKLDKEAKTSLKGKRRKAGWNNAYLAKILLLSCVNDFL